MRWSGSLMTIGILICAIGLVPLYFGGVTIGTLEGVASIFTVGTLLFLLGLSIRRVARALKDAK